MATPKLLASAVAAVAAVAALSLTCLGLRTRPEPTQERDSVVHDVSRSRVQRVVRRILAPTSDESVQEAEQSWEEKYENRCVTTNEGNEYNFNSGCDRIVENLSKRINGALTEAQLAGHLEEVEDFEFCPTFHWVDDENRTGYDMLASPGAHSHYEYEWMDCVSSIYAYTEEEYPYTMVCMLTTLCRDSNGNRVPVGSYYKYTGCDMEATFRVQEMFKVLAQRTPEPMGIPED